jgi:hypothetical protein
LTSVATKPLLCGCIWIEKIDCESDRRQTNGIYGNFGNAPRFFYSGDQSIATACKRGVCPRGDSVSRQENGKYLKSHPLQRPKRRLRMAIEIRNLVSENLKFADGAFFYGDRVSERNQGCILIIEGQAVRTDFGQDYFWIYIQPLGPYSTHCVKYSKRTSLALSWCPRSNHVFRLKLPKLSDTSANLMHQRPGRWRRPT